MYLKSLQIVNYKNIKATTFYFSEGTNTIIGENDSGKTNAMNALRILLDDSYYYTSKRLKISDFSDSLNDWKGHSIIISATFSGFTEKDETKELCQEIKIENECFLKNQIQCKESEFGNITLFIRPGREIRKKFERCKNDDEFIEVRNAIKLTDYEFHYTARANFDFTKEENYKQIVGDIENCKFNTETNEAIIGGRIPIQDVNKHISVIFIDALRDVKSELYKPYNPIRRIVETIESTIKNEDIENLNSKTNELNTSISNINQIDEIGQKINNKLRKMVGQSYSPNISMESQLSDDLRLLSKYLTIKPSSTTHNDINLLGLGHLNTIYMALKLVEFEYNMSQEVLNIMIIEEPEAHIHNHIQKTLFNKMKQSKEYTQIIMTTHSTYISEISDINKMNIMKCENNKTISMLPGKNLDLFGENNLDQFKIGATKNLKLSECIERYLDVKRNLLLFSKGVILVEGDGEEILIPTMFKYAFGITLDELGVAVINVGSTSFEYIACLFENDRIKRNCSIITDMDKQLVGEDSNHYKKDAEEKGTNRKKKLEMLFATNNYVECFFAETTLEIEFSKYSENVKYIKEVIDLTYKDKKTREEHIGNIESTDEVSNKKAESLFKIINKSGKGWYSILLSKELDGCVLIPQYILEAIIFATKESINDIILVDMCKYVIKFYKKAQLYDEVYKILYNDGIHNSDKLKKFIETYPNDNLSKYIKKLNII